MFALKKEPEYTAAQIREAIARWQKVLESIEADEKKPEEKKSEAKPASLKQKIKEGIEQVGTVASVAKSAAAVAQHLPEAMQLAKDLIAAINRGAEAVEKLVAQRAGSK